MKIKLFKFHFTTELYALYMYLYFSSLNFIAVFCIHSILKSLIIILISSKPFIMLYFHIGLFVYLNKGTIRIITYSSLKIKYFCIVLYFFSAF